MRPATGKPGPVGRAGLGPGAGAPHLQPLPPARRHRFPAWSGGAAAHRSDEFRLGLRQPFPRDRRLAARSTPSATRSGSIRASATSGGQRRRPDPRLRRGRRLARAEGDGGPRHQPHRQRRAARRGAARRVRSRRGRRHPQPLRGRSRRPEYRHGLGRPRRARATASPRPRTSCCSIGTVTSPACSNWASADSAATPPTRCRRRCGGI